jgi:hypothetical protein
MAAKKFLSGIDNSNQRLINVADGSSATDVVTLQQLQAYVKGLTWKQAVVVKDGGSNITVSAPGATINGHTMAASERFLLANQTAPAENGIYVWTGAATPATRALDATSAGAAPDGVQTLTGGMTVYVELGTINADTAWTLTTDDPIVVGTTALAFAQLGGGTTYSNGNGLNLSAGVFSIKLAGSSGLVVDGTGLYVDSTIVVKKYAANVGDGSSTAIVITHSLGTRDVIVALYEIGTSAYYEVETDVVYTSTTTITLNFATAPTSAQYRVVVHA